MGFALPIGWAMWQLWDLKREKAKDAVNVATKGPSAVERPEA